MARGKPVKQTLIGHSVYGEYKGQRQRWVVSITDLPKAEKYAEEKIGILNVKAYPIYKDEN